MKVKQYLKSDLSTLVLMKLIVSLGCRGLKSRKLNTNRDLKSIYEGFVLV